MDLDDYLWLVSDHSTPWLDRAAADARTTVQLTATLRKDLSAARTHLVLEQTELRRRAVAKFPDPGRMFFLRKGLEQATDLWLARYKAARLADGGQVADLCCGIGGDLISFAERGPVRAVDSDPIVALLARANLCALGLGDRGTVITDRVDPTSIAGCCVWHLDPDRRASGYRTVGMERFEPPLELVAELLRHNARAAIKLAPATEAPPAIAADAELEWISRDGDCRQQVAWCGCGTGRRATVLDRTGNVRRMIKGEPCPVESGAALHYVYEPDAAILAAHLEGPLAAEHGLHGLGGGYLTGDLLVNDRGLATFEVIEAMPFDRKRLAGWLAEHGIGRVEVKCRDGRNDANRIQRELSSKRDGTATVLLAPHQKSTIAIIANRIADSN